MNEIKNQASSQENGKFGQKNAFGQMGKKI